MKRKMTLVQVHSCLVATWTMEAIANGVNLLTFHSEPNSIGQLIAMVLAAIALLLLIISIVVKREPQDERSRENMRKATNKSHRFILMILTLAFMYVGYMMLSGKHSGVELLMDYDSRCIPMRIRVRLLHLL